VAQVEDEIVAAGAEIIWVLEMDLEAELGTADSCDEILGLLGSEDQGWCVGDEQTEPVAGTFNDSPFSLLRGFDIVVPRSTMVIEYSTSHGTPEGNENLTGKDILAAVQDVIADVE
jgi:hypothetical protein